MSILSSPDTDLVVETLVLLHIASANAEVVEAAAIMEVIVSTVDRTALPNLVPAIP